MNDTWQHLTPYQPAWKDEFAAEKSRLQSVFGVAALEIEHIGSTSIEGMPSKPIIDIAVMIESYKGADVSTDALTQLGYEAPPPGNDKSGERYFYIKSHPPKCNLSIAFADQGGFWPRQIVFRDYLRSNSDARAEYAELKEESMRRYQYDRKGAYSQGKTEFVYRILRLAGWRVGQLYRGSHHCCAEPSPSVTDVVAYEDYTLSVTFDSSETGVVDLSRWVQAEPFCCEIRSYEDFRTVRSANGTIEWDCGIAMDPSYVYSLAKLDRAR